MKCKVGYFLLLSPLFIHACASDDVNKGRPREKDERSEQLKRLRQLSNEAWTKRIAVFSSTTEELPDERGEAQVTRGGGEGRRHRSASGKNSPKKQLFIRSMSQKLKAEHEKLLSEEKGEKVEYSPRTFGRLVKANDSHIEECTGVSLEEEATLSAVPTRTVSDPCLTKLSKE